MYSATVRKTRRLRISRNIRVIGESVSPIALDLGTVFQFARLAESLALAVLRNL
jgi:hypothetical protein